MRCTGPSLRQDIRHQIIAQAYLPAAIEILGVFAHKAAQMMAPIWEADHAKEQAAPVDGIAPASAYALQTQMIPSPVVAWLAESIDFVYGCGFAKQLGKKLVFVIIQPHGKWSKIKLDMGIGSLE